MRVKIGNCDLQISQLTFAKDSMSQYDIVLDRGDLGYFSSKAKKVVRGVMYVFLPHTKVLQLDSNNTFIYGYADEEINNGKEARYKFEIFSISPRFDGGADIICITTGQAVQRGTCDPVPKVSEINKTAVPLRGNESGQPEHR